MFQKIKGVLIYTFYRTVNHYNTIWKTESGLNETL